MFVVHVDTVAMMICIDLVSRGRFQLVKFLVFGICLKVVFFFFKQKTAYEIGQ